jgi:hypothetical protein
MHPPGSCRSELTVSGTWRPNILPHSKAPHNVMDDIQHLQNGQMSLNHASITCTERTSQVLLSRNRACPKRYLDLRYRSSCNCRGDWCGWTACCSVIHNRRRLSDLRMNSDNRSDLCLTGMKNFCLVWCVSSTREHKLSTGRC